MTAKGERGFNGTKLADGDEYKGRKELSTLRAWYQRGMIEVEGDLAEYITSAKPLPVWSEQNVKPIGGGWYEAPDGEKIQGKDNVENYVKSQSENWQESDGE